MFSLGHTFGHGHKFLDFPIGKGPSALGDRNKQKYGHFVPRKSDLRRKGTLFPDLNVAPRYLSKSFKFSCKVKSLDLLILTNLPRGRQ